MRYGTRIDITSESFGIGLGAMEIRYPVLYCGAMMRGQCYNCGYQIGATTQTCTYGCPKCRTDGLRK